MRGIAELVEVKSSPPTPSLPPKVSPSAVFNGTSATPNDPLGDLSDENTKTPEPPVEGDVINSEIPPPVLEKPNRASHDEITMLKMTATPPPEPCPRPNSEDVPGFSNFSKMRDMLAMNMGISQSSTDAGEAQTSEESSKGSCSPSHSPMVQRRQPKPMAGPPPPRRGPQTALTPNTNRHSLSSSTSSLSSNQSERVAGSHDVRGSVEVPLATQQHLMNQVASSPGGGVSGKMVPLSDTNRRK